MYRVIVCGSRYYENRDEVNRVLDALLAKKGPSMFLICGGAIGADNLALQWALSRKVDHTVLYAKWETEGKDAGPNRNLRMLKLKPKLVVAFRVDLSGENRGTDHMCKVARQADVKVKRFM